VSFAVNEEVTVEQPAEEEEEDVDVGASLEFGKKKKKKKSIKFADDVKEGNDDGMGMDDLNLVRGIESCLSKHPLAAFPLL
jgi:hypothetical protein